MAEQTEFNCVSCETAFDPAPTGGFCPDCNTPHPDYDAPESDDSDGTEEESGGDDSDTIERITDADDADGIEKITDADDAEDEDADADDGDETIDFDEAEIDADTDDGDDGTEGDDDAATIECQSCESSVDASAAFCPNCGSELADDEGDESEDEAVELSACPDCGNSVDDESFCPNCGTDLDAVREGGAVDETDEDEPADDETADDEASDDEDEAVPEEVTLEIDGESYTFGDGDVFGRRDEEWLADLVSASGGREEARYLSSEHLEFSVEDDGVYVTDVSTNGTKLNGTAMDGSEEKLEDGDTLTLADRAEIDVTLS